MMSAFTAIYYHTQSEQFLSMLKALDLPSLPLVEQFVLLSAYRQAELEELFKDCSFSVCRGDTPVAIVMAHKNGDVMGFEASGVTIFSQDYNKKMMRFIYEELTSSAKAEHCATLKVNDNDGKGTETNLSGGALSPLGLDMYNANATPHVKLSVKIDLTQSSEEIFSGIRDSYRNLINQHIQTVELNYITRDNCDRDLFDTFKAFHLKTAGRQTRSDKSWNVQFKMIEAGFAELILGYMPEQGLVSSALLTDFGSVTSYAVAVYERSLFSHPLGHVNVYEGIKRAKERGQIVFDLGIIIPYTLQHEKEYNIGYFKKGFCRSLSTHLEWCFMLD